MGDDWKPRYGLVPKPDFNFEMDFMQLMQENDWPNTGYQEPETETGTDYEIYSCGDAGRFAWAYDRYFELDYLHVDGTDELWEYALSTFSRTLRASRLAHSPAATASSHSRSTRSSSPGAKNSCERAQIEMAMSTSSLWPSRAIACWSVAIRPRPP